MACDEMWCSGQGSLPPQHLSRLYYTLPQEPDVCPSIALARPLRAAWTRGPGTPQIRIDSGAADAELLSNGGDRGALGV